MATTATSRSPGCFRGYSNEQKTLRAKLAQLLKWTRDLKTNIMKQSCKALQHNNHHTDENRRQTLDQIHDELDEYKRKLDRELGRIHDICDALTNNPQSKNDADENLDDEILAALRRSPTYSSLEQHIYDDRRPRIRVKPRERIHPGRSQIPRSPFLSTDTIKRKATQPIALQLLDTSCTSGTSKRRAPVDAFKRSRSFTNVEHQETTLGIDYIEEDESDLAWKPFEPKRSISQTTLPSFEPNTDEASTVRSVSTVHWNFTVSFSIARVIVRSLRLQPYRKKSPKRLHRRSTMVHPTMNSMWLGNVERSRKRERKRLLHLHLQLLCRLNPLLNHLQNVVFALLLHRTSRPKWWISISMIQRRSQLNTRQIRTIIINSEMIRSYH